MHIEKSLIAVLIVAIIILAFYFRNLTLLKYLMIQKKTDTEIEYVLQDEKEDPKTEPCRSMTIDEVKEVEEGNFLNYIWKDRF